MYRTKPDSPRELHRAKQAERIQNSPTLAEKFPQLKSLTAELNFSDADRPGHSSDIKYYLNLIAKSVFRVSCRNDECVGGDFDLSAALADAVKHHRVSAEGEMTCPGWIDKHRISKTHCSSVLKYRLTIGY